MAKERVEVLMSCFTSKGEVFAAIPPNGVIKGFSLVMAKERAEVMMSCFTSKGEVFAAILPNGVIKVWNTSDGNLLAEWKQPDGDSVAQFSCIACSFVGKKRRKDNSTCLVALGTDGGEVFTINATAAAELKWKSSGHHHSRIAALSFANKGHKLCSISTNGTTCEMNSETGELLKEIKIPKKHISSSVYLSDDIILAASNTKIRVLSLEDGEEQLKFSTDAGPVNHMCMLDDRNILITSGSGDNNLQVWKKELSTETVTSGPVLSMRHPPLGIECKSGCNEDDLVVLSVSESGIAYIWNFKTSSTENVSPTKIKVETAKSESESGKIKKHRTPVLAARLNSIDSDDKVTALIAYGSINSPQFTLVNVETTGGDIVIDATNDVQENGLKDGKDRGKKRPASDVDSVNAGVNPNNDHEDPMNVVEDIDEPTMGEKLASLNIVSDDVASHEKAKPPSADSVHVLLKQALHADDRSLLLDCLFRKDEKVISNSVSFLNPSDVFKLLESLISMIQSRGAVVACALPWLKSLLLQHASSIISQESSLIALNSLYQLIESRISTFNPTVQLSSCLDLLYTKTVDGVEEEEGPVEPIIFEDMSDEEDEEGGDAMETDEEDNEELEAVSNVSDLEGSDDAMVDY